MSPCLALGAALEGEDWLYKLSGKFFQLKEMVLNSYFKQMKSWIGRQPKIIDLRLNSGMDPGLAILRILVGNIKFAQELIPMDSMD